MATTGNSCSRRLSSLEDRHNASHLTAHASCAEAWALTWYISSLLIGGLSQYQRATVYSFSRASMVRDRQLTDGMCSYLSWCRRMDTQQSTARRQSSCDTRARTSSSMACLWTIWCTPQPMQDSRKNSWEVLQGLQHHWWWSYEIFPVYAGCATRQ